MQNRADDIWARASNLEDNGRIDEAISLYEKAIAAGSTEALVNLGNIYDDKIDPPQPEKAVRLYEIAVERGNSVAAWNLYKHYMNSGYGQMADHWLKAAARLGDEDAIKLLR